MTDEAIGKRIRAACAKFMEEQPAYLPTPANEAAMFRTMEAHDELSPTSVACWHECFALCRNQLTEVPAPRKQPTSRTAPPAPTLTREEVDSWTAAKLQREIERSPERAAAVEAALSRR